MDHAVRLLFHELADLPQAERQRVMDERQIVPELRAELESLWSFDSTGVGPLSACVLDAAEEVMQSVVGREVHNCGPYRLVRLLERGGMGAVYLGERMDGEIQQTVAVKLLRADGSRPGWHDRFLKERQLLASLNHPSIVHVIDAGHTTDGRPYLVMEYVEGVSIDVHASTLEVRERLMLFLRVCEGVSHAHQRLIIHRDLKPSNILVDASGQPKVLDFGIARILDDTGDATQTVERLLTPNYASPEQLRGTSQTTATDIYSLGAVLYKILTGRSPHESDTHTSQAVEVIAGLKEIPAPSRLNPKLPADLDYILGKALRLEPEDRYASVDAFANDIRAFLESRPVQARSGNAWYYGRKFLRRYWAPVAAAAAVIASLSIGLYIANRERTSAQSRFQDLRQLAHIFVFDLHDEVAKVEGNTRARELMVRTGLQYLDHLARNAGSDLGLQKEIAASYMKVGDAQGGLTTSNLGRFEDALASYRKAGDIYRLISEKDSAYLEDLAVYYAKYAQYVRFTHDLKQARAVAESAIETFDRLQRRQRFDSRLQYTYIGAWCTLGDIDEDQGNYQTAWKEFSRCGELARAEVGKHKDQQSLRVFSQALERIGTAAQEIGLLRDALQAFDEDESALRKLLAVEPLNPRFRRSETVLHQFRSRVYYDDRYPDLDDPQHALTSARHYLAGAEEMVHRDPNNMSARVSRAVAMYRVSVSLREFDPRAAIQMARQAVQNFDELIASGHKDYLTIADRVIALRRLGEAQLKAGRVTDAYSLAESALTAQRGISAKSASGSEDRVELVHALILAGQANAVSGNLSRAESLLREASAEAAPIAKRQELPNVIPLARAQQALGAFYGSRRRIQEARACFQELDELWRAFPESIEYVHRQKAASARLLASVR
jgi:serine/threonine protein kinase